MSLEDLYYNELSKLEEAEGGSDDTPIEKTHPFDILNFYNCRQELDLTKEYKDLFIEMAKLIKPEKWSLTPLSIDEDAVETQIKYKSTIKSSNHFYTYDGYIAESSLAHGMDFKLCLVCKGIKFSTFNFSLSDIQIPVNGRGRQTKEKEISQWGRIFRK